MSSLAEYLKRYTSDAGGPAAGGDTKLRKKKKKKEKGKKTKAKAAAPGLVLVDDDPTWQRAVDDEDDDEEDEEAQAQVEVDMEVKRERRMEERRQHRPYLSVGEDGSGWVNVDATDPTGFAQHSQGPARVGPARDPGPGREIASAELADSPHASTVPRARAARHDTPSSGEEREVPPRAPAAGKGGRHDSPDKGEGEFRKPRGRHDSPDGGQDAPRQARGRHDSPEDHQDGPRQTRGSHDSMDRHDPPGSQTRGRRDPQGVEGGEPPRRRHDSSDSDEEPPRRRLREREERTQLRRMGDQKEDPSPPPRMRGPAVHRNGDLARQAEDLSRPRRKQEAEDLSPPRRKPRGGDLSPPRRGRAHGQDLSPSRRGRAQAEDLSPPRRGRAQAEDLSPPRRGRAQAEDLSPPRRGRAQAEDLSPPRRGRAEAGDLSPPRRRPEEPASRRPRWDDAGPEAAEDHRGAAQGQGQGEGKLRKGKEPVRMSDGSASGLVTGSKIAQEMQAKKDREALRFAQMDATTTGRGAETIHRDKSGRKLSNMELIMQEEEERKKRQRKVLPPPEWGKGLAQKREVEQRKAEMGAAAEGPFAVYETDEQRDGMLKERLRFGDPMAHLVKKKGGGSVSVKDFGEDEKMAESGFAIPQDVPPHSWMKRKISPPYNRYNILPGRHWDGVDRSTGFERELFKKQNERQARNDEAYKWSVADM